MTITPVTQTQPAQTAAPVAAEESRSVISSDFETFLNMLTAQLENQDPLDPVKSEDFAVQLATFSGVEQQVLTNELLESLLSQNGLSGLGQYAGWVGMEARAPVAANFDGSPLTLMPKPETTAQSAMLVVENEFGTEVQRLPIPVAPEQIEWSGLLDDGVAPNGLYSFKVESYSNGLVSNTSPVEVYTQITEARVENGEGILVTEGGVEVNATAVTGLRQPN